MATTAPPPQLTSAPLAAAVLLLLARSGLSLQEGLAPATALRLAALADRALDQWSGHHDAAVEEVRRRVGAMGDVDVPRLTEAGAGWWFEPLQRDRQVWLASSWDGDLKVWVPATSSTRQEQFSQRPGRWFATSTLHHTPRGPFSGLHALLAEQAVERPPLPASQVLMRVDPDARVYEVRDAADWYELCRRYGVRKDFDDPPGTAGELVPDWAGVSRHWDGVHLSFGALLSATYVTVSAGGPWSRLWAWETEQTIWLRPVVEPVTDLGLLERPGEPLSLSTRLEDELDAFATERVDVGPPSRPRRPSPMRWGGVRLL